MKRKLLLLLIVLSVSFTRCQKDSAEPDAPPQTQSVQSTVLLDVQQWHGKTVSDYKTELSKQTPSVSGVRRSVKMLEPLWETARMETLFNGAKVVVVSSKEYELADKNIKMLREFVFLLSPKDNKIRNGKIVEFIGDADFIIQNKRKLITKYQNDAIVGYNGSIMTFDINYRFLRGKAFQDGNYTGEASYQFGPTKKINQIGSRDDILNIMGKVGLRPYQQLVRSVGIHTEWTPHRMVQKATHFFTLIVNPTVRVVEVAEVAGVVEVVM